MNVMEAAQFREKEYINRIFLAVLEIYEKGGSSAFSEYKCSRTAQMAATGRKEKRLLFSWKGYISADNFLENSGSGVTSTLSSVLLLSPFRNFIPSSIFKLLRSPGNRYQGIDSTSL